MGGILIGSRNSIRRIKSFTYLRSAILVKRGVPKIEKQLNK